METVTKIPFRGEMAVLGNSMDITEQISHGKNRLEALEASILEAIPHAVIGLQDRRIIFANDGVQTVFGWKSRDLIGMSTGSYTGRTKTTRDGKVSLQCP